MNLTILKPLRWSACLLLLSATVAHAALTQPATKESLLKYFDEANAQAMAVRADLSWKTLEPIAVESYQRTMQEADLQALLAYGQSASGRVRNSKLTLAMLSGQAQSTAYLNQRIGQVMAQKAVAAAAFQKPADGTKEALAYALLLELPGAREEFNIHMTSVEETMLEYPALAAKADAVQRQISYEDIAAQRAGLIAASLTETELKMLIEEQRKPGLRRLLAMQRLAERDMVLTAAAL